MSHDDEEFAISRATRKNRAASHYQIEEPEEEISGHHKINDRDFAIFAAALLALYAVAIIAACHCLPPVGVAVIGMSLGLASVGILLYLFNKTREKEQSAKHKQDDLIELQETTIETSLYPTENRDPVGLKEKVTKNSNITTV